MKRRIKDAWELTQAAFYITWALLYVIFRGDDNYEEK